jgi:hypothetical protein
MRRAIALLLLVAAAASAAGCSGADAQEAQALLAQSDAAWADVTSATFSMRLWTSGAPQDLSLTMSGGGYAKGKHEGDFYVLATADNAGFGDFTLVNRNGRLSMSVDGQRLATVAAPKSQGNPVQLVDFSKYVKDVRVEHGKELDGQAMTKLSGLIDTGGVVDETLSSLGKVSQLGGGGVDVSKVLGDTHIALYISDATHMPMRGLIDLPVNMAGTKVTLHMDFAYTSVNEPVAFPGLT